MDSTKIVSQKQLLNSTTNRIHVNELHQLFDQLGTEVKIISLDCFDTILWRTVMTPKDVFYIMQQQPAFKAAQLSARMRAQMEDKARSIKSYQANVSEVNLAEIYRAFYPAITDADIAAMAAEELNVEKQVCFSYPPMLDFISRAKERGYKIIIVSDTYFSTAQIRELLQHCLPENIYQMIDQVFCSNEYGYAKGAGLFKHVINKLRMKPEQIFHLGDNVVADYVAPQILGIPANHLLHYDQKIEEMTRMHALAANMLDQQIRLTRPMVNPFRGVLANPSVDSTKPEVIIGYMSVGTIMYAFTQFILRQTAALVAAGKKVRVAFLMRDGYLPYLCCEAHEHREIGHQVHISRFTSYAASFRTAEDVDEYVSSVAKSLRFDDICRQLLLPDELITKIVNKAKQSKDPIHTFTQLIYDRATVKKILEASSLYRQRLITHLKKTTGLQAGETLVFVDLGYTGTSQIKLAPILRDEMDVDTVGCYLLSLETARYDTQRLGMFDGSWCDQRTLQTLVHYIALLEQISTMNENSVIDYRDDGSHIYSTTSLSKGQHENLEKIQAAVIQFIHDAREYFAKTKIQPSIEDLRDYALAELGRFLYFPTDVELNYLKSFEFEVNMGVNDILNVLDHEKGMLGLRKRGLFFMEKNLKSMRTNYPAELRYANIELAMTLMQQHRSEFEMHVNDFSMRREKINIIAMHNSQTTQHTVEALLTYDGYYSLILPVGMGDYQVGIHFGKHYKLLQIESTELIPTSQLYGSYESHVTIDAHEMMLLDQITDLGDGLYSCEAETGLFIYAPEQAAFDQHYVLRIVFRPILGKI